MSLSLIGVTISFPDEPRGGGHNYRPKWGKNPFFKNLFQKYFLKIF